METKKPHIVGDTRRGAFPASRICASIRRRRHPWPAKSRGQTRSPEIEGHAQKAICRTWPVCRARVAVLQCCSWAARPKAMKEAGNARVLHHCDAGPGFLFAEGGLSCSVLLVSARWSIEDGASRMDHHDSTRLGAFGIRRPSSWHCQCPLIAIEVVNTSISGGCPPRIFLRIGGMFGMFDLLPNLLR